MEEIRAQLFRVFESRLATYGPTWDFYRFASLIEQIQSKLNRLLQDEKHYKVAETKEETLGTIYNYCAILIIKTQKVENYLEQYAKIVKESVDIMLAKNADYGDAWKDFHTNTIIDIIRAKIARISNVVNHKTKVETLTEKQISDLFDIINYCVFAIIQLK